MVWKESFKLFIENSISPLENFFKVEEFLISFDLNISVLISDIGTYAFTIDDGKEFFELVKKFADQTDLSSFRFLAAWLALNNNNLDICIEECEKIEDPDHSTYTLQGQAYLESGRTNEAIEVLKISAKINPNEALSWFQLSKAYLVVDDFDNAWDSALQCQDILGQNTEVSLLLSMIALKTPRDIEKVSSSWNWLSPSLEKNKDSESVIINLLDLSFANKNKSWAETVINGADWEKLKLSPYFLKSLGAILRILGQLEWMDLSSKILSQMNLGTEQMSAG